MQSFINKEQKVEEYIDIIKESSFPIRKYDLETINSEYDSLCSLTTNKINNVGLKIVETFHPSIWRCNVKGCFSPVDAWGDLELMRRVILNRFKYLNTFDLSLFHIRAGLSISKLAPKVSIFKPMLAKYLIEKYLNDYEEIFDPCAGFSGRMLGCCSLGKNYIGYDVNSITVAETKNVIKCLNLDAQVSCADSIYEEGAYECLFTCPPYGDKEIWHQDVEVLNCDEWIDVCLQNYKCKAYLFVVDDVKKYKNSIVEEIKNKSHFGTNFEKVVLIK